MTFLPFYVAEEERFFEAQKVRVRCIHSSEGKEMFVRLAVEQEVAFFTAVSTTVEAVLRSWGEVRALCANVVARFPCMVRPEIQSLEQLKGRKVMVGGGRSNNEALYICSRFGWQPGKDIELVHGDAVDRIHAFQDPEISAVFARAQYLFWAEKAGFRPMFHRDPKVAWYDGGLATSVNLIRKDPDVVQRVVTAVVQASQFVKENEEEAIAVALRRIPYLDQEQAQGNYKVLRDNLSCDITATGIHYMAKVLGQVKGTPRQLKLEEVADLSFLHQAHRELGLPSSSSL